MLAIGDAGMAGMIDDMTNIVCDLPELSKYATDGTNKNSYRYRETSTFLVGFLQQTTKQTTDWAHDARALVIEVITKSFSRAQSLHLRLLSWYLATLMCHYGMSQKTHFLDKHMVSERAYKIDFFWSFCLGHHT